jgi:hypothetical protein
MQSAEGRQLTLFDIEQLELNSAHWWPITEVASDFNRQSN